MCGYSVEDIVKGKAMIYILTPPCHSSRWSGAGGTDVGGISVRSEVAHKSRIGLRFLLRRNDKEVKGQ